MTDNKSTSRRNFITAGMADTTRGLVDQSDESRASRGKSYLETYAKNAMACEFQLLFNLHQYKNASEVALGAFALIDQYEDRLSVYRDHSEVSQLNQNAYPDPVEIESDLMELLRSAQNLSIETGGAFDVTSTPLSKLWGFFQRQASVPTDEAISEALELVSYEHFELLPDQQVKFSRQGIHINLGSIGKGFTLDRVGEWIDEQGIEDCIIHGGQSSVVAKGCGQVAANQNSAGWNVGISHPLIPAQRLAELQLIDTALGTSGTGRQGFFHNGRRYGHIIDPRTGWPTDHFLSTTVICKSAAMADALATAFFVMPLEEIQCYLDKRKSLGAIVVRNMAGSQRPEIETFNLDGLNWKTCI